jgi:hypothetical protein
MNEHDINQVLVTDDGHLKGMLNRARIMHYLGNGRTEGKVHGKT